MQNQNKALVLTLTAVLLWSTVAVPFKFGLRHFHYIHFLFITVSIAVICSFFNVLFQNKLSEFKQLTKGDWALAILGGILNPFLYYLMLFKAYQLLPAQMAQALNYTWPIMLVLLSAPLLGQKLNTKSIVTLFIGFCGVYLVASEGQPWPLQPSEPLGVVLALLTSLVWALYWLLNTRSKVNPSINLLINFSTGWVLTLPLFFFVQDAFPDTVMAWLSVGYSGFFEMGLTFAIWLSAMRLATRTDQISNYMFIAPFLSLFFIFLLLGEPIYSTTIFGLLLIISSVLLNRYLNRLK